MKVVYIAGKYRGPTPWAVEQNIQAAQAVAAKVIAAGHMPLTPHLNTAHMEGLADDAFFLAGTMELLRRCDVMVLVPGWSTSVGAKAEVAEALARGMPIFGADAGGVAVAIVRLCAWANGTLAEYDKRKCNLHDDCDEADRKAKEAGKRIPHHCRSEDCEDCFGQ